MFFVDRRVCAIEAHVGKARKPIQISYIYNKKQENAQFFTSYEVGIRCFWELGVGSCLRQHRKIQENTMLLNRFYVKINKTQYFSLVQASVIRCCTALINVTLGLIHALFLDAGLGRYCSSQAPGWFPDWAARVRFGGVSPGVLLCSPSGWGPNRVPQQNKRSHIYSQIYGISRGYVI